MLLNHFAWLVIIVVKCGNLTSVILVGKNLQTLACSWMFMDQFLSNLV